MVRRGATPRGTGAASDLRDIARNSVRTRVDWKGSGTVNSYALTKTKKKNEERKMQTRTRTRLLLVAVLYSLFVLPFSLSAQDIPVFRTKTDLVVVPVTVTDRSGRFVPNLTADQFEL